MSSSYYYDREEWSARSFGPTTEAVKRAYALGAISDVELDEEIERALTTDDPPGSITIDESGRLRSLSGDEIRPCSRCEQLTGGGLCSDCKSRAEYTTVRADGGSEPVAIFSGQRVYK